jgi:hypothetical protein
MLKSGLMRPTAARRKIRPHLKLVISCRSIRTDLLACSLAPNAYGISRYS